LPCEACAGEGDRADGADPRVDRNLAAGAGNRDPMVPVVNEVELSHPAAERIQRFVESQ
jgi:hypothetical protein